MEDPELDLFSILEAPIIPQENKSLDWSALERKIRFIPDDYKKFIQTYGTGQVDNFFGF
jgi:hypothetical protein